MFPTWKYPLYVSECEEAGFPDIRKPEGEALLSDTRAWILLSPGRTRAWSHSCCVWWKHQESGWIVKLNESTWIVHVTIFMVEECQPCIKKQTCLLPQRWLDDAYDERTTGHLVRVRELRAKENQLRGVTLSQVLYQDSGSYIVFLCSVTKVKPWQFKSVCMYEYVRETGCFWERERVSLSAYP